MTQLGNISLENIGKGVAIERFSEELKRVIENIIDPNTEAKAKRSIRLTVTLSPTKDRNLAKLDVACISKLAPVTSFSSRAYLGNDKEHGLIAFEDNPNQIDIEAFIDNASDVTELKAPAEPEEEEAQS